MDPRHCFKDYCSDIQDDQTNQEAIDDFIPFGIPYFGMKKYMCLQFNGMILYQNLFCLL